MNRTTRLVPAILVKEQLLKAATASAAADPDRLKWWRGGPNSNWMPAIDENDWRGPDRAVIQGDEIIGCCSASFDRLIPSVHQLSAVSFRPGSVAFIRALHRFCDELLNQTRVIRFTCTVGNPAMGGWRKWVKANGGEVVGTLLYDAMIDGRPADNVLFQVPGRLE